MQCMTLVIGQRRVITNHHASSVMSWVTITPTVMALSMTPWSAWRSIGRFDIHSLMEMEILARLVTIPLQRCVIPKHEWLHSPWRLCVISMRTPSISSPTMTGAHKNQSFSQVVFLIYLSTVRRELLSVWQQTSHLITSVKLRQLSNGR